jgi:hypothetical protein
VATSLQGGRDEYYAGTVLHSGGKGGNVGGRHSGLQLLVSVQVHVTIQ